MRILSNNKVVLISGLLLLAFSLLIILSSPRKASAAYDGGRLIDNGIFLNSTSMNAQDIQSFLIARGGAIANRSFVMNCVSAGSQANNVYISLGAPCGQTVPASQIIYYSAQVYGVNPRVIIATMQKEQSLITATNPTNRQFVQAMGYGCPTTGNCDDASNFFWQVDNGTWVLRFHYERARGNMNWWYTSTTWTCGTEKNFYKPNLYPNQNVNFYDEDGVMYRTHFIANAATSAFYCYTPHAYNNPQGLYGRAPFGTVGRYYSGSYNFVLFYELWFGSTLTPSIFKPQTGSGVYVAINGFKVLIPAMHTLQDYGYDPSSISTIPNSLFLSIPAPSNTSSISSSLSHLVKSPSDLDSDGGTVYFVSVGVLYPIQSMSQFNNYGFSSDEITYLPLSFIQTYSLGNPLSNYIRLPDETIFRVNNGEKNVILSNSTFMSINPSGTNNLVSTGASSIVPSGNPYPDGKAVFIRKTNNPTVYAYNNGNYYVMNANSFGCWGIGNLSDRPLRTLFDNYLPASISTDQQLSCVYRDISNQPQILTGKKRQNVSSYSIGSNSSAPPLDLSTTFNNTPGSTTTLSQFIKSVNSQTVWFLEDGNRRAIPSMSNLDLLKGKEKIETVSTGTINSIPQGSIKLADGQTVKHPDSAAVYVINNGLKYLIDSSEIFNNLKLSWSNIETYSRSILDSPYPTSTDRISRFIYSSNNNLVYLLDISGCYIIPDSLLSSYGQNKSTLIATQKYSTSVAPYINFGNCNAGSKFIRSNLSSTVFILESGIKHSVSSWSKLIELNGGNVPAITLISSGALNSFSTGVAY